MPGIGMACTLTCSGSAAPEPWAKARQAAAYVIRFESGHTPVRTPRTRPGRNARSALIGMPASWAASLPPLPAPPAARPESCPDRSAVTPGSCAPGREGDGRPATARSGSGLQVAGASELPAQPAIGGRPATGQLTPSEQRVTRVLRGLARRGGARRRGHQHLDIGAACHPQINILHPGRRRELRVFHAATPAPAARCR